MVYVYTSIYTVHVCIFVNYVFAQLKYIVIDDNDNLSSLLHTDEGISDLAIDSPSG